MKGRPFLVAGAILPWLLLATLAQPGTLWSHPPEGEGPEKEILAQAERLFALGANERALEQLQRAVRLAPRSYGAQKLLGLELLIRGRYPEASAALERALALAPPPPTGLSSCAP